MRAVSIAKDIVRGKMHNQYLYLQRINRKFSTDQTICNTVLEIGRIRNALEYATTIEQIRGLEGDVSRLYFSCFGKNIVSDWTAFYGRNRNPPLDPVNAVLSFLYTVIANKISGIIYESGLDPGVGTLHSISYGRESLVFDLLEEYRTPIVDTLTCSLFNLKILNSDDFRCERVYEDLLDEEVLEQIEIPDVDAVLLSDSGKKKVLEHLENKLDTLHQYPLTGKTLSYRKIMKEQIRLYKQVINGEMDHYYPLVVT